MTNCDVFNGDADGICALHQLRLAQPREALLITGVKRDVALLHKVEAGAGDEITVLDISMDANAAGLHRLLASGARVAYFDHHFPGDIPSHPLLQAHIDTAPDVCTSLIVDRYLGGKHRAWAVAAAFGDNMHEAARRAARPLALAAHELAQLQELGECINYNAYGEIPADLFFHPAELYKKISAHESPFSFIKDGGAFATLKAGFASDMERAQAILPKLRNETHCVLVLPDAPWSRRVSGAFANRLVQDYPRCAYALLTHTKSGFVVSVRAPLASPRGADALCRRFATGGGRAGAAGINHLPENKYDEFIAAFLRAFST